MSPLYLGPVVYARREFLNLSKRIKTVPSTLVHTPYCFAKFEPFYSTESKKSPAVFGEIVEILACSDGRLEPRSHSLITEYSFCGFVPDEKNTKVLYWTLFHPIHF